MVDPNALLAAWLRLANIAALPVRGATGSIYAVDLPDDIDITNDGPAVVVCARSGTAQLESPTTIIKPRMMLSVWADVFQNVLARQVYGALADYINANGKQVVVPKVGTIISCYEVTPAQDLSDPDTGFARVIAFYEMFARS